jgi:hypothetical protein
MKEEYDDDETEGEEQKAFQVRLPLSLYKKLQKRIKESRRSLNSEIIVCLEDFFAIAGKSVENMDEEESAMQQIRYTKIRLEAEMATLNTLIEKHEAVKAKAPKKK